MDHHISEEHRCVNMDKHGGVSIELEDRDPIEDDDHVPKNTFEDDGTNWLIHDIFGIGVATTDNDDDDDDNYDEDDIEFVHDIPLHEKANMTIYKGSQSNLLSIVLLLVNLKVMNGSSNIIMLCMLRFFIYIIIVYKSWNMCH